MNINELSLVTVKDSIPYLEYHTDGATSSVTIDICKFEDYINVELICKLMNEV